MGQTHQHVVRGRLAEGDRDTYPAGHPSTWGLISNESYPHPVFDLSVRRVPGVSTAPLSRGGRPTGVTKHGL